MAQSKEQNKISKTNPKEIQICEQPDKEFKITVTEMLNKLKAHRQVNNVGKVMNGQNENIHKELNFKRIKDKF